MLQNQIFIILMILPALCGMIAQSKDFTLYLIDEDTNRPISGAHVFIDESSVDVRGDNEGKCKLKTNKY